jgi:chromatin segregation and condensation protein Rec8/ScpA/Scc1 (kleisin family)
MVLVFLALLELVKELEIRIAQSEMFGEIVIVKRDDAPPILAAEPGGAASGERAGSAGEDPEK